MSIKSKKINRGKKFFIKLNLIKLRYLTFKNNKELSLRKAFIV